MILMYHKVDLITPSYWWISAQQFEKQIAELINLGYEFTYLDDYELSSKSQVVLTFDDAYENIYHHAFPILKKWQLPFEVFMLGDMISQWNDFDHDEMRTRFCGLEHLREMADFGGRIQWHTRNHSLLPNLNSQELDIQLTVNPDLKSEFQDPHFRWFAYPHGVHNQDSVDQVRKRFVGAVSVNDGSNLDIFQLNRVTVHEGWMPPGDS